MEGSSILQHAAAPVLLTACPSLCSRNVGAAERSQLWAPDLTEQENVAYSICRRVFSRKADVAVIAAVLRCMRAANYPSLPLVCATSL